jgi:hypothetical protein
VKTLTAATAVGAIGKFSAFKCVGGDRPLPGAGMRLLGRRQ